ncbi:DUF4253 domain-containing protein [Amycolatopsis anabasis]|uniref:DUF4253 domain-containing protein n=1 Tax=Amycolatopsis anabasis TaxID=1840409 RepID=UPI00131CAAF8|nr:DUF4253 domain-containing protein [Amycolatopsis anabasis]
MTVIPFRRTGDAVHSLPVPSGRWHCGIWVSDRPLEDAEAYRACVAAFGRSGLWPVLIPADGRFARPGDDWIDDRGRLAPAGGEVAAIDPAATLAAWWPGQCCEGNCLWPFGAEFPGLALRSAWRRDELTEAADMGALFVGLGGYRLGLVAAARPADVPALLGWAGTLRFTAEVAAVSAVLRSWEDRFGALLVVLGYDELRLAVAAPPATLRHALAAAAEHRAFCPRSFAAQPADLRGFAGELIGNPVWSFRWD